jgi:hypothetical protein
MVLIAAAAAAILLSKVSCISENANITGFNAIVIGTILAIVIDRGLAGIHGFIDTQW